MRHIVGESYDNILHQFLVHAARGRAQSPSDGVAVRYVLPVLWMTLCLHIMARYRRPEKERMFKMTHQVAAQGGRRLMSTVF